MKIFWETLYWSVFCLCWFILPTIQGYEEAGEFSAWARLRGALSKQVKILLIAAVVGIAFIGFLLYKNKLTM